MRYAAMFGGGVLGLVIMKLLAALLLPLLGTVFGMMLLGLKIVFWLALGYFVYRMFCRRRRDCAEV